MSGGNVGVLGGEMRGVLSFSSVFFNDAVSCYKQMYWNRIKVNFIFHMLFDKLVLVTNLLLFLHF
jgi:hypothetical protein